MGVVLQFNSCYGLASSSSSSSSRSHRAISKNNSSLLLTQKTSRFSSCRIRAVGTVPDTTQSESTPSQDPPSVKIAFVNSMLLPDGTPDITFRVACGGQKLRNIMLDTNIELYGPYNKVLSNCGGGGTCATCAVEVISGKGLLSPKNEIEKEKLKRNPRNWRLACQTTVGEPDSEGLVVVQQLPEWKAHEWKYVKHDTPPES